MNADIPLVLYIMTLLNVTTVYNNKVYVIISYDAVYDI